MRFSFVIPTYNKREFLKRTLAALNPQAGYGRKDYEVIVVDDGSSEDVLGHIKKVNSNYPLNYIYLDRSALSCRSRSRNYGLKAARGKYVIFIDDDMLLGTDYLAQLDRYYEQDPELVIVGTRINCPVEQMQPLDPQAIKQKAFTPQYAERMLEERHVTFNSLSYNLQAQKYPWMMSSTCNLCVPKKQLMRIGGFDESFLKWGFEDMELGYRLHTGGSRFVVNSKLPAFHQEHPAAPEGANNFNHFIKKCKDAFKDINPIQLTTVFGQNTDDAETLKPFRAYGGVITQRQIIEFRQPDTIEAVKQEILAALQQKGIEIIVRDSVEDSDLDIWCQLHPVSDAVLHYQPQSLDLTLPAAAAVINYLLAQKTGRAHK